MSINQYAPTIGTTGQVTVPTGNFFYLIAASAAVEVRFEGASGQVEDFVSVGAGLYLQRIRPWRQCKIIGPNGTTVNYFVGAQNAAEDITDYKLIIATITGGIITTSPGIGSSQPIANKPDVTVATGVIDTTVAANPSRRTVTIGSLSTNAPLTVNLRIQGGAGSATATGFEIPPGQSYTFPSCGAFAVYNPDANSQKYWWSELT